MAWAARQPISDQHAETREGRDSTSSVRVSNQSACSDARVGRTRPVLHGCPTNQRAVTREWAGLNQLCMAAQPINVHVTREWAVLNWFCNLGAARMHDYQNVHGINTT